MKSRLALLASTSLVLACAQTGPHRGAPPPTPELTGTWRAAVKFQSGSFAGLEDLQFMYVFHPGGTMIESSNHDAAPPVPPAYGIWRRTGKTTFEARYEFFLTGPPARADQLASAGWPPSGRGVLVEQITIGPSGDTYTSTLRYTPLDARGNAVEGAGEATARAARASF